jgi:hypothetical protein
MSTDPMPYIYFTAFVCFSIGFMSSAVVCSRRIRDAFNDGWKSGVRSAREQEPRL